jgi:hypothetical protein
MLRTAGDRSVYMLTCALCARGSSFV